VFVVVGVTGGIAAYKTVGLVRLLVKAGHDVHVVPTDDALGTNWLLPEFDDSGWKSGRGPFGYAASDIGSLPWVGLTNALVGLGTTLDRFRTLAEHVDVQVVPLVRGVTNSLGQANLTLARLREAVEDVRSLLGPEATLRGDLALALSQIAAAGQSISELADFLQRHPNALITGRSYEEKKR